MIRHVKKFVSKVNWLSPLARKVHRKIFHDYNSETYWIDRYTDNTKLNIIQIGSNDGITGDPLYRLILENKNWNVVFVEPIPYLFEKLKTNYGKDPRFKFVNAAINDGTDQTFYWVRKEAKDEIQWLPLWYDQLGSFNRENIVKHLNGVLEPYIVESEIKGLSLNGLLEKFSIEVLDILHIDTEGYDWKILSQLDMKEFKPSIILVEHKHLEETEKREMVNFLNNEYLIIQLKGNFLCLHKDIAKENDTKLFPEVVNQKP